MVKSELRMADERTPIVKNAWYVACTATDIARDALLGRRIAEIGMVLYRDNDGRAVALRDRCPHRAFPLSKSELCDGEIVCGYHGFRFAADGRCTNVPSQAVAPGAARVRTFPVIESDGFIWVWPGDTTQASEAPLPTASIFQADPGWGRARGSMEMKASYVHLHENLLDLSHLSYLHGKSFAGADYAETPCIVDEVMDRVRSTRMVSPTKLPPIFANPLNMVGRDASREVKSTFVSPGLSLTETRLRDLEAGNNAPEHVIMVQHMITPIDKQLLLYHFSLAVSFADGPLLAIMEGQVRDIFNEDRQGLEALTEVRALERDETPVEVSVRADQAGVSLRRRIARLAAVEASTAVAA